MRMVTSKMSIEETIEVLREDLKTNVRSKAWRKHILLNPKVEGMARFPSGVDSVFNQHSCNGMGSEILCSQQAGMEAADYR